jgi:hypothetical protein
MLRINKSGAFLVSVSYELFAVLQVEEACHKEYDAADREEQAAFEDYALPDYGVNVSRYGKGIEERIPEGVSQGARGIYKDKKYQAEYYDYNGRSVSASRYCGKHKCQIAEEQHWE